MVSPSVCNNMCKNYCKNKQKTNAEIIEIYQPVISWFDRITRARRTTVVTRDN